MLTHHKKADIITYIDNATAHQGKEPKMTHQTISKTRIVRMLAKAGDKLKDVYFEIRGTGLNWSVECADRRGSLLVKRVLRHAGVRVGGYRCGHGGWVWDNIDRSSYAYTCDFNDKASIHHY